MTRKIPFTVASVAASIKEAEQAGESVVAVRTDGKLILESGSNGVAGPALATEFVYFVSDGDFIKIGYSIDWKTRIEQIQAHNARQLTVLAVLHGSRVDEATLHSKFANYRVRPNNEWFRDCLEIREFIAMAVRVDV